MTELNAAVRQCAQTQHASAGAASDAGAIGQRFQEVLQQYRQNLAQGEAPATAMGHTPKAIPDEVAQHGVQPGRPSEVREMVGCVAQKQGLDPGVTGELKGMYSDAVNAARFKKDPGVLNFGRHLFGSEPK